MIKYKSGIYYRHTIKLFKPYPYVKYRITFTFFILEIKFDYSVYFLSNIMFRNRFLTSIPPLGTLKTGVHRQRSSPLLFALSPKKISVG